jgi:branched-chain amino acid aminotransferase
MNECFGEKFILNGIVEPSGFFDNSLVYDGDSVYEVIRMVKGNPVFFSDHIERLVTSARLQSKRMLADESMLKRDIINLTKSDKKKEVNLKIVFNYNKANENYLVYFIEPTYPSESQYKHGVKGILFYAERKDPESKVINHKLRSSIFHKLILDGAYEALLVNGAGMITEGSRTNIFFIKKDHLVTAPDGLILNGITRKHVIEICKEDKIKVKFDWVSTEKIYDYDSVFMTGTSPIVLPFNCIDNIRFKVDVPIIKRLRDLYLLKAEESILKFRTEI